MIAFAMLVLAINNDNKK
ncbi:hypothetical protein [Enterococcus hirae]